MAVRKCMMCGNDVTGRAGKKYCSKSCRQRASYKRVRMEALVDDRKIRKDNLQDILTVSALNREAADNLLKIADLCGAEVAALALDAVWLVMEAAGVDFVKLQRR